MRLLVLLVIAAVVIAIVLVARRRREETAAKESAPAADPLRRDSRGIDPRKLKVGDVVHHEGHDYLVRGTIAFDEDGFQWQEHLIDDASGRRWLSVEEDEELELVMWDRITGVALTPGSDTVTHDGVEYRLDEHGHASYTSTGSTGTPASGRAEYFDYTSDERRLSFERYTGDTWEVSVGQPVNERSLDIYPTAPER